MELYNLPSNDSLQLDSKVLENRLRRLKDVATETGGKYSEEHLREVSRNLESIFVKQLLDTMQKSVPESSLYGSSSGMETWKGMFNEKLAGEISDQQSIGLADMIYNQLATDLNRHKDVPPAEGRTGEIRTSSLSLNSNVIETQVSAKSEETGLPGKVSRFIKLISETADRHGLDPTLIAAVITQESGGNPMAVSPAGARGLMQLMPKTGDSLGVDDPFDPSQNIEGGTKYLKNLLDHFDGDETLALAAYNAGPSAVKRYGKVPPYAETRDYVRSVKALKKQFNDLLPGSLSDG
jgi:Rod binding domain-containing protein